jgi:hypothetical protein
MAQSYPNAYRTEPHRQHTEGVMDQVSELGERAQTLTEDLIEAVKERPYTTLAIAAGAAFAVGALWMIGRQIRPQTRLEALQAYLPEIPDVRGRIAYSADWNKLVRRWWR